MTDRSDAGPAGSRRDLGANHSAEGMHAGYVDVWFGRCSRPWASHWLAQGCDCCSVPSAHLMVVLPGEQSSKWSDELLVSFLSLSSPFTRLFQHM